jgi:hypothetical protein
MHNSALRNIFAAEEYSSVQDTGFGDSWTMLIESVEKQTASSSKKQHQGDH